MVAPTEQNQLVTTGSNIVIVIRLPSSAEERILCLPLLYYIVEFYPKAEIHLLTPKKHMELLNLLPFKAYYHVWLEEDVHWPWDIHREVASLSIRNVSIFINLTDDWKDGLIGFNLRAKIRLGFNEGFKKYIYHQGCSKLAGQHKTEQFLSLWDVHTQKIHDPRKKFLPRELEEVPTTPEFHLIINVGKLSGMRIDPFWRELLDCWKSPLKILILSVEDEERFRISTDFFRDYLPDWHEIEFWEGSDWTVLSRIIDKARGVITEEGEFGGLSAYLQTSTLILYKKSDPQITGPFMFNAQVKVMQSKEIQPHLVADAAYEFFHLGF